MTSYVAAINRGFARIRRDGFPLSVRIIREMHEVLFSDTKKKIEFLGEFRTSHLWTGAANPESAAFVAPPPERLPELMNNLEAFLNIRMRQLPVLTKAALALGQFENIRPFQDGNGRLGRLLVTLILCAAEVQQYPLLYLSLYFKQNYEEYQHHLHRLRNNGDWLGWVRFFINGVCEIARQSSDNVRMILKQIEEDRRRIEGLGKRAHLIRRVYILLQMQPILTVSHAEKSLGMKTNVVRRAFDILKGLEILSESAGPNGESLYIYGALFKILDK